MAARMALPGAALLLAALLCAVASAEVYPPPDLAACINSDMNGPNKPKYTTYDDFVRGEPSRCVLCCVCTTRVGCWSAAARGGAVATRAPEHTQPTNNQQKGCACTARGGRRSAAPCR